MPRQDELLHRFLAADTWEEARDLAMRQPALIAPEIHAAFLERMSTLEPGPELQELIDHQQLLSLCRVVGVETAFQDLLIPMDPTALVSILSRLPQHGPGAARRILFSRRFIARVPRDMLAPTWALAVDDQGKNLMATPFGSRAVNHEQAIYWFNEALTIRKQETVPAEWAETTANLGTAFVERMWGDRGQNLDRAIELFEGALGVDAHRAIPQQWVVTQSNLALAYHRRISGDREENLERAISSYQKILTDEIRDSLPRDWAHAAGGLALTYIERLAGDREDNLQKAIDACRSALEIQTREDTPHEWAETMAYLGSIYSLRRRGDHRKDLERALRLHEEALAAISREEQPTTWASLMHGLGAIYPERLGGDVTENIERGIGYLEEALTVRTRHDMPWQWAWTTCNLGANYMNRRRGDREENIERAWKHLEAALEVLSRSTGSREWVFAGHNLANAYRERTRGDRRANLERAIELYEQVCEHLPPPEYLKGIRNLALAYSERLEGSRSDNLRRALDLYREAERRAEGQPEELAKIYDALAQLYHDLGFPGDRTENFERSLALSEKALKRVSKEDGGQKRATFELTRANTLLLRARGSRQDNLHAAAESYRRILTEFPEASERVQAIAATQLGRACVRWQGEDRESRLEEAVEVLTAALEEYRAVLTPCELAQARSLLGDAYNWRMRGTRAENLELAIEAYEQALQERTLDRYPDGWIETVNGLAGAYRDRRLGDRVSNLMKAASLYRDAIAQCPLQVLPSFHRELQGNLGRLHFYVENWEEAVRAFEAARSAGELLYQASATRESRQEELRQSVEYPSRAAYSLARLDRLEEAIEVLEAGRTRFLAEALTLDEVSLEGLSVEDRERFEEARETVDKLEIRARALPAADHDSFAGLSEKLAAARERLSELIERLRQERPGFFDENMDFPTVATQARRAHRPLCYLVTTLHGSLGLIVDPRGVVSSGDRSAVLAVWQDDFSSFDLRALLWGEGDRRGYLDALEARPMDVGHLTTVWPHLQDIVTPFFDCLSDLGYDEVVLIPCGSLGILPIHALRLESMKVTVAPSARVLQSSLDQAEARRDLPRTLLAIGNPSGNLDFAQLEIEEISKSFAPEDRQVLIGSQATRAAVISASPATYLHWSCHGEYQADEPLNSAFHLAEGGRIHLRDLLDGEIELGQTRLAALPTCETAVFDVREVPDEMIGLPVGMLLAGVPGIVGILWRADDLPTAFLMMRFVEIVLEGASTPSAALAQAQLWLRGASAKDLLELTRQRLAQDLSNSALLRKAEKEFGYEEPTEYPYDAPYYWAGFRYLGS